mgnify:CR=1 FL=1
MSDLIEAEGLIKSFGRVKALNGLDLGVGRGQIHGFLGPNGAGKSTTIRVLLGMYRTDGGRAQVLGMDPAREASAINRRLAYVPGSESLLPSPPRRTAAPQTQPPPRDTCQQHLQEKS